MLDPLRSVVVDGITIGHPCCGVHDCTIPLESGCNRFCRNHQEYERKCCVVDCNSPVESGFKTCADAGHRNYELHVRERGKAMFQLKDRLKRINSYQTHDALSAKTPVTEDEGGALEGSGVGDDCEMQVDEDGDECGGKSLVGNRKVKARFGRRRTHNEELCVASCGTILGRMTFYGSESPTNVRVRSLRSSHFIFVSTNHLFSNSLCAYFPRKSLSLGLSGMITTANYTQFFEIARTQKIATTLMSASFLLMYFILRLNTRLRTITAMQIATLHSGQNCGRERTVLSGDSTHLLLSKSTLGLVDTKRLSARCRLTAITFSSMK